MSNAISQLKNDLRQKGHLEIQIKVVPKSSKTEIVGFLGDAVKIRIAAVAAKNKANQELVGFLAKTFQIPKQNITITSGLTSARKIIYLQR